MISAASAAALDALHRATALYTVEPVCDTLLARIDWPTAPGNLADPSAGDGMFLVRALDKLEFPADDLRSLERVRGWEIHPDAVANGRERIAQFLISRGWTAGYANRGARQVLKCGDFLLEGPRGPRFRYVAGNPPYIRYGRLPEAFKAIYAASLCDASKGDLLHAFLIRCAEVMTDDGVMGFVTSDRWLLNSTAAALRLELGSRVGIQHLSRLDARNSFYRPKDRRKGSPPRIHPVEVVLRPTVHSKIRLSEAPVSPDHQACPATQGPVLSDIATVRLAPWLGPANIFVVDAEHAKSIPSGLLIPAVDTDDVDPRTDRLSSPQRYAIRTNRNATPPAAVLDHLSREMHRMPKRGIRKTPWLPPEKVFEDLSEPAILIPRIGRKIRAIHLPPGILPINHNLYVVQAHRQIGLDKIEAVLRSAATHEWLTRNAPRLENGYYDIRSSLIRRIPVTI